MAAMACLSRQFADEFRNVIKSHGGEVAARELLALW